MCVCMYVSLMVCLLPCLSLAVSVKMNILLFAPALLLAYLRCLGVWGTVKQLTLCAAVQVMQIKDY